MDVLTAAQALFVDMLASGDNPGTAYLAGETGERRPTSPAVIATAGLGYAFHGYSQILLHWGYDHPTLIAAGLLDDEGREVYGDRLTFPWLNMAGTKILGLGGRAVVTRRPKYVNTPEPMFSKGSSVFGIAQAAAAIHGARWAVIVEGPFDATALWDLGWTNSVATVGAKVTADQLAMVARLANDIVVLLDADEGGRRGRDSLAAHLQREHLPGTVQVLAAFLPGAKDAGDPSTTKDEIVQAIRSAAHI